MKKHFIARCACAMLAVLLAVCTGLPASAATIGRRDRYTVDCKDASAQFTVWPEAPDTEVEAAIVLELNTGVILYEKNAHKLMYPASMTKIMTGLLAAERCSLDEIVTLSHASVTDLAPGGYVDGYYEGETLCVEDALYAMMLNSNNTIAYALAEHMDGTVENFVRRMNTRANELGLQDTDFQNPNGLNDSRHLTTAYDMAMILWEAIQNDTFLRIASTLDYSFSRNLKLVPSIDCHHTVFQMDPASSYYDSRVVCGKTGFVDEAGYCLATYAADGNLDLITITMNSHSKNQAAKDNLALMDYGFDNFVIVGLPVSSGTQYSTTWPVGSQVADVTFYLEFPQTQNWTNLILTPNSLLSGSWEEEVFLAGDKFHLKYTLGGEEMVVFPLSIVSSSMNLFEEPTEPASESSPESSPEASTEEPQPTEEPTPAETPAESTQEAFESGTETQSADTSSEASETDADARLEQLMQDKEALEKSVRKLTILLVVLGVLLLIAAAVLAVVLNLNRKLRDVLLDSVPEEDGAETDREASEEDAASENGDPTEEAGDSSEEADTNAPKAEEEQPDTDKQTLS